MIEPDELFRNYNMYRRAVRRGYVSPLTHNCGTEYVSGYGENDQFVLNCWACDTTVNPGTVMLDTIKRVVEEYFE